MSNPDLAAAFFAEVLPKIDGACREGRCPGTGPSVLIPKIYNLKDRRSECLRLPFREQNSSMSAQMNLHARKTRIDTGAFAPLSNQVGVKWNKPFLGSDNKTMEECIDYIRRMTLEENVDPLVHFNITTGLFERVNQYIEAPMTATTIKDSSGRRSNRDVITNELIYYWMTALGIPFECEKWHLNRLLMLIRVCNVKNSPQKKMSKRDIYSQNHALNAARKKQLGTHG